MFHSTVVQNCIPLQGYLEQCYLPDVSHQPDSNDSGLNPCVLGCYSYARTYRLDDSIAKLETKDLSHSFLCSRPISIVPVLSSYMQLEASEWCLHVLFKTLGQGLLTLQDSKKESPKQ